MEEEEERTEEGVEGSLVRAVPTGPRSGERSVGFRGRVPGGPSGYFSSGRGGIGRGRGGGGVAKYSLDSIGRGNALIPRPGPGTRFGEGKDEIWRW